MILISREQFLEEHNKLSPLNLKCTFAMLDRFKEEKLPLLKDGAWCLEKHRIPFISWLSRLPAIETKSKKGDSKYKNYPETHY